MSAIAGFIKLAKAALNGLKTAASDGAAPGATSDGYYDYLRQNGQRVSEYRWDGFLLATLLVCLQQKNGIDLMKSEYDELAANLTKARNATHFIFTPAHKSAFSSRLDPKLFSESEVRDYFNQFNQTSEQWAGAAMLDGVVALQSCLSALDDDSVAVFSIS
jgi:hypothetical protein